MRKKFRFAWQLRSLFLFLFLFLFLSAAVFALPAPTKLNASAIPGKGSVYLSWSPVAGAIGFNIYRKTGGGAYAKLNLAPIKILSYEDRAVRSGRDYMYVVRSIDGSSAESLDSPAVGAPLMEIKTTAKVTTMRDEPVKARSIRTGKIVTFASPGDIINYNIGYANYGYGTARNVVINFDVPDGTVIAGPARVLRGASVTASYYDSRKQQWVSKIEKTSDISRVRCVVPGNVAPVLKGQLNGLIEVNVVITI